MNQAARNKREAVFDALGSPVRRDMVKLLSQEPRTVGDLASRFPISRPAVSKHLKLLTKAGLVSHQTRGNRNIYRLEPQGFQAGQRWLEQFWGEALARLKLVAENTHMETNDE